MHAYIYLAENFADKIQTAKLPVEGLQRNRVETTLVRILAAQPVGQHVELHELEFDTVVRRRIYRCARVSACV